MLSFKSYLPDDKGFGYLPHDEDPCKDLFDQFLNEDPIESGDSIDCSDGFHAFEFAFDEETESSESCSADSNKQVGSQPAQPPAQPPAQSSLDFGPVHAPLPLRTRPKLNNGDAPERSISGSELLNLEGKLRGEEHLTRVPSLVSSSAAAPTLRRKGKFCVPAHDTPREQALETSKAPSADMIRQSSRRDSPSYNEWTQRFEQFSIQTPVAGAHPSNLRGAETHKTKRPAKILTQFDGDPRLRRNQAHLPDEASAESQGAPAARYNHFGGAATAPLSQDWRNQGHLRPSPLTAADFENHDKPSLGRSQTQQLRHPPSWEYGPVSPLTPDYGVSVGHVQPGWLHNLPENNIDSYFDNAADPPPTPSYPETTGNFTSPGLSYNYEPFNQFVNGDPSHDYNVHPPDPFFAPPADQYENTTGGGGEPPTNEPPSRSLSTSPPLHSPSKSRLRSKSHRRQKSMNALKSPKSANALKSHRSAKDLRTHKSTGTFGFVNFTEADKGKILTGVAPSGSSKTKARRELEAADRKRRMSLAALRAVEEAGGDVEVLKRVEEFEC